MQTSGLLGERSIAIVPKTPDKGITPEMITDKTPFYADSIDPLENTFNRLSDIGEKLNDTVDMVQTWFNDNGGKITLAVDSFGSAMSEITTISRTVNELQLIPQLKEGSSAITNSMEKVDAALARLHQDGIFDHLGPIASNLSNVSNSMDKICQSLVTGQGTMGKLMQGDDMYLRMTAIMSKLDTMMNDVNHYGVLFHLNKGWQRTRTKRAVAINALGNPTTFKTYFQTEIDQINTSMARISMLIDKAQMSDDQKVLENQNFKQNFAELMRQVEEMSSNLRLYNEKLSHP
jgi:phospholipid/cholesterol/gamma-HCH transport system substrate-binding protein